MDKYTKFNFSGFESATDFLIFTLAKRLSKHPRKSKINIDEILLNGCKNITLWSLLYLSSIKEKNLLDLHKSILSVRLYFINFVLLKNKILFRYSLIKELLAVIL